VTGVGLLSYELDPKRLQLLRELLPRASTIGVLVNANNPAIMSTLPNMNAAAEANGQKLVVLDARTQSDIDAAFVSLPSRGVDALLVATNPFYEGLRHHIVTLAKTYSVPVLYPWREYAVAGGLISYGTSFTESYRQAGFYVGRILNGEKAGDLPVVQPTKFEMLVNIKTAKLLGITVPPSILVAADEVIE
jgi:putative ABC transport system substrate-binding protein